MTPSMDDQQRDREQALRQAAMGKRVTAIEKGNMAPVLRRWVNADVAPMAESLRGVASTYLTGDMGRVAVMLGTPTAELSQRERPLTPLMQWVLRGTQADDICLAFMGTVLPRLCSSKEGAPLGSVLSMVAHALKDTVQGQFIVTVQGAAAMQALREKRPELWAQRKSLKRIATQLKGQVKPQILREQRGETELPMRGHRKVVSITDWKGDIRRLELMKTPDELDWQIMDLCWQPDNDSSTHRHLNTWLAFATMLLSLAQQASGWFEVADKFSRSQGRKKHTKLLILSDDAHGAITRDVERWVGSGFVSEPMLVPPVDGDFLTVKHRKVTGQRPPKGLLTRPEDTYAWREGACGLATSPWTVNAHGLTSELLDLEDPYTAMKVASHRRLGEGNFYLPVNMDFRGRIYYRTPWVTPQSNDLGKSLLAFPNSFGVERTGEMMDALRLHFSALAGMDKQGKLTRLGIGAKVMKAEVLPVDLLTAADAPLTLQSHWALFRAGEWDRIPIQLDGTCNGLQHLSALVRDEVGGLMVNLMDNGGDKPSDIYGVVAKSLQSFLDEMHLGTDPMWVPDLDWVRENVWAARLQQAGVVYNRKLCKTPVMCLPYGGTLEAIRMAVKASVLEQLGVAEGELLADSPWHKVEEDGYGAFRSRPLADHPLFNADVARLGGLIHKCIQPAIPRAMLLMQALQGIGKWVGTRAIAWSTGPDKAPMWVVQAKSKSARKQVTMKGYHLPDVIRRLTLVTNTNEVDPKAHRTGIIANFVHSLDAEHMARTVGLFKERGGTCVGGIHDCVMVRPSETALMHRCLRETFMHMYERDPLSRPVKLIETEGLDEGKVLEYGSWYELAEAAGVTFPERGTWVPSQVLDSQWFFS